MVLESACLPVPSEIIMTFSGFLVFAGQFNFWLVVLAGACGNLFGSLIAYLLGLMGLRKVFEKYGKYILVSEKDLERADRWFIKYGPGTAFFSRFLPLVRTFISLPAGIARMDMKKFIFYTIAGSFAWSVFLTYIGFQLGENWQTIETYFRQFNILAGAIIVFLVLWFVKKHFRK